MFWKDDPNQEFNLYNESAKKNPYGYVDDLTASTPNDRNVLNASKRYCKYSLLAIIETILAILLVS